MIIWKITLKNGNTKEVKDKDIGKFSLQYRETISLVEMEIR